MGIGGPMKLTKFFPLKGPSGTYSHRCTSLAVQSFIRTCDGTAGTIIKGLRLRNHHQRSQAEESSSKVSGQK
jgi:hypothetical protein